MVIFPYHGIVKIIIKALKERLIKLDFSTLKTLPGAIGGGTRDGIIDPISGDVILVLIIEYCLEGRKNLLGLFASHVKK